ncbi:hypothetical protein GQX73_g8113 [Xylaria multiplex]|uniref:N-acetyltransferase domain-containing protein n=1 Tax=Xylaria multiplex TaxID=323545 RepID=A0A7C8IJT8_9PEZI|nr:hypothetical protein GQX73_g8113 [Xylaria multiplex]
MATVDNRISGRLALITGASGGIGAAVARSLWAEGSSLALTGFSKFQAVEDLVQELLSKRVHENQKDGPDILVSNAGYGKRFPGILDVSIEEFDYTININLRASFILTKLAIPHMEAQGWGRIIFVSSIAAIGGGINACHYAASKAGLSGMMKNLAARHAKSGITVNDVAPAMIGDTGMIPDAKHVAGTAGDEITMGTPFITHLEPTRLDGYNPHLPHDKQSSHIPAPYKDAMSVREKVFVKEQACPLEFEHDADDARSCHWVMYASVKMTTEPEERDPDTDLVVRARRSETVTMPIGTLRIPNEDLPPVTSNSNAGNGNAHNGDKKTNENNPPNGNSHGTEPPRQRHRAFSIVDERRMSAAMPFGTDRRTDFHDGKEPYVKLGRLAVLPEFRGHQVAVQLWNAAKKWLRENPTYFNPSVKELGMDTMKVGNADDIPKWNGLICVHAQEAVVKVYERWGFKVDKGMGKFYEEGIPHVGMFQRLEV